MPNYHICLNGTAAQTSPKKTLLRLMKTIDGSPKYVTIGQCSRRTLVAALENEEELDKATAKQRLAALLIPLITEYASQDASLAPDDRVRIVFGETEHAVGEGKTCLLFAEDASTHLRPTLQSKKSGFSNKAKSHSRQTHFPSSRKGKARRLI